MSARTCTTRCRRRWQRTRCDVDMCSSVACLCVQECVCGCRSADPLECMRPMAATTDARQEKTTDHPAGTLQALCRCRSSRCCLSRGKCQWARRDVDDVDDGDEEERAEDGSLSLWTAVRNAERAACLCVSDSGDRQLASVLISALWLLFSRHLLHHISWTFVHL